MDDQNRNLILATALSFLVILVWFVMFPPPDDVAPTADPAAQTAGDASGTGATTSPATDDGTGSEAAVIDLAPDTRINVETPTLSGTISLTGGRFDDMQLLNYRETLEDGSPNVTLLRPKGSVESYFALFGWVPSRRSPDLANADVPGANTVWSVEGSANATLTPNTPVTLVWSNDKGLTFRRILSVDDTYMINVTQQVENNSTTAALLAPLNQIVREGVPSDLTRLLVHEGAFRQSGEELTEISYEGGFMRYAGFDSLDADSTWGPHADVTNVTQDGWLGFTNRYWMTVLIPASNQQFRAVMSFQPQSQTFRTAALYQTLEVAPGTTAEVTSQLFVGAKEWTAITKYEDNGVYRFTNSTDWGWYFFLTKPFFRLLNWLYGVIGNMGWAILALTLIIKAVLFPLAYKSYVSMAKMKELQPEMEKIKERAGDDRQKLQQEMMQLYKTKKVNPASGCLPILLQIPIFFSLYKVILVTLEIRHAPWIGWIKDLSAPDPSSIINLFGLLPYAGPADDDILKLVFIGILPILLGISMWLQQKLNPAPTDPTQQMIFAWMPWVFMFMLGAFASGLVIYWIANNVITFVQQYTIMRSQGYKPDVFGNIISSFRRKQAGK